MGTAEEGEKEEKRGRLVFWFKKMVAGAAVFSTSGLTQPKALHPRVLNHFSFYY